MFTQVKQYELFTQVRQSPVMLRHDTHDSFEDSQLYVSSHKIQSIEEFASMLHSRQKLTWSEQRRQEPLLWRKTEVPPSQAVQKDELRQFEQFVRAEEQSRQLWLSESR